VLGNLGQPAGTPGEGDQSNHEADAAAAQPVNVVLYLVTDDGDLGHRRVEEALLEAGVAAEEEPEHGDHDQQQGNNAKKAL
jgi:hypothetical protein